MKSPIDIDESHLPTLVVTINRPERKNAVDKETAHALHKAFTAFDKDDRFSVAILRGAGGTFCAGADLKSMLKDGLSDASDGNPMSPNMADIAPMGCTRLQLQKPVIAAVSGHAVAGGLELALWCDLRVADSSAVFGVYCRMRGVPLIDGGTVRLPLLIGLSAASDMILTGRSVDSAEAARLNLANYVVPASSNHDAALARALELAAQLAAHPQRCMRNDRLSMLKAVYAPSFVGRMEGEFVFGLETLRGADFGKEVGAFVRKEHAKL